MTPLNIGLDIDDVLFPWSRYAHEACEAAGVTNGASITQWSFYKDYGITSERLWEVLNAAYVSGMLLRSPVEGAVSALRALVDLGHTVHLVTARGVSEHDSVRALVRNDTKNWLHRYGLPHHSLTFTEDKRTVETDYFVDDSLTHYDTLDAAGRRVFLHEAQHNKVPDCARRRVASLTEYVDVIRQHKAATRQAATTAYVTNGVCK